MIEGLLSLDPRTKLALAASYAAMLMLTSRLELLLVGLILGALLVVALNVLRLWLRTLRYKVRFADPDCDPDRPGRTQRFIYVFWQMQPGKAR